MFHHSSACCQSLRRNKSSLTTTYSLLHHQGKQTSSGIILISSILLLQLITVCYCAFPANNIVVMGGGGTFAEEVHKGCGQSFFIKHFTNNIEMNYNATGSGTGLLNLINYTSTPFDYAAGELIPSTSQYAASPGLQLIPFIGVNVLVVFNLPGISSLTLSRQLVVDIFAARVTKWNDAAIAALNPSVTLPDATIKRVVRSDSSGTTELFTSALAAFATGTGVSWTPGVQSLLTWPSETSDNISKQKGTAGISNYLYQTAYTIAYNTPSAVFSFTSATIINKYGTAVVASETSCKNAMTDYQDAFDSLFSATIVDAPGKDSYPISGYSYIIYKSTSIEECSLAQVLYRYFSYLYSGDVDTIITAANFVPLPSNVKAKVQATLDKWDCSSGETAVTSEIEIVAVVLLSIAGGIVAAVSLGIVFGVSVYAQWKKKKDNEESTETD